MKLPPAGQDHPGPRLSTWLAAAPQKLADFWCLSVCKFSNVVARRVNPNGVREKIQKLATVQYSGVVPCMEKGDPVAEFGVVPRKNREVGQIRQITMEASLKEESERSQTVNSRVLTQTVSRMKCL